MTVQPSREDGAVLGFRGGFFNHALRSARLARGWTQRDLEARSACGAQRISQYETLRDFPPPLHAEAIADALGKSVMEVFPEWLREYRQEHALRELPLDQLVSLDVLSPAQLRRAIGPGDVVDVEEVAVDGAAAQEIRDALWSLTDKERMVLELRFGFDGKGKRTLDEVGQELNLNVTRERIRQIELKALRKLRRLGPARRLIDPVVRDGKLSGREGLSSPEYQAIAFNLACLVPERPWQGPIAYVRGYA